MPAKKKEIRNCTSFVNIIVADTYLILDIGAVVLGSQQVGDLAALGGNGLGADLGRLALGDTVEDASELVAGVLADLLSAVGVVVVKSLRGAQGLDEREVARAASRDDLAARQHGELNRQRAGGGASTVDQDRITSLATTRQRQTQTLVQTLTDSRDSHTERGGFLVREVLGHFHLHIAFGDAVLREAAVFLLDRVDAVREAGDAVARLEVLGHFGADLHDGAHVVTADGAAFALLREEGGVDVLPGEGRGC